MLNSKFGLRQAANVVSAANDKLGNLTTTSSLSSPSAANFTSTSSATTNTNQQSQHNNRSGQSSTNHESYVIAKYDYQSQGPQELSIRKGDRLLLIDDSRHWWKVLKADNLTGFVPSNYVKREKQSLFDSIRRGIRANTKAKKSSLATTTDHSPSSSPLISKSSHQNDIITTISPVLERDNFPFKKPYNNSISSSGSNNNNSSDNNNFSDINNKQQPQISHSDILVRELGPNFNGNSYSTFNNQNTALFKTNNNINDLMSLQHDDSSIFLKTLNSTTAIVKYNYKSQQPDELSLVKGIKISVLEKSDDGWWKGELDGKIGWFPSNYVLEQPTSNGMNNGQKQQNNEQKLNSPFKAVQSKQNSYSINAATTDVPTNNWSSQINNINNSTKLPTNEASDLTSSQINSNNDDNPQVLFVVIALYSFQSQNNEELSFAKDEHLDIIEKPANDPDWWRACNQLGETGLVPKNYVQIVPTMKSIRSWSAKSPVKKKGLGSMMDDGAALQISNMTQQQHQNPFGQAMAGQSENFLTRQSSLLIGSVDSDGGGSHFLENNQVGTTNNQSSLAQLAHELETKLKLHDKIWYHGIMSRQQCDQLLNAYAEDGDFLIRNSETNAGDFSVSLKAQIRNKHFRVHYADDSFCIGQRKFDSLDELVEHYKRTPIYTSAMGEKMFLKKAYCR